MCGDKIPLMGGCGVIPPAPCACDCECDYTCLTLTKVQDVDNRATYDQATGVLNLPPAIVARRQWVGLGLFAPPLVWIPVVGLDQIVIDTTGGQMAPVAPDDRIIIPRDGHYDLFVSAQVEAEDDGVVFVRMVVTGGSSFNRTTTAPIVAGIIGGADVESQASPRAAGDIVQAEIMVTSPAGAIVNTVSVSAAYVEGT